MALLSSLTDEELIHDMRSGDMTAVEAELTNRLEKALAAVQEQSHPPMFAISIPEVLDADGEACEPAITLTEQVEFPANTLVDMFRALLELDPPGSNSMALGCGLEDRGITDRYEAAAYGFEQGADAAMENVHGAIADVLDVATKGIEG